MPVARTITTTVRSFKRLANTAVGNPVYKLVTDHGTYKSAANTSWVYRESVYRFEGQRVELEIGGRGTITDARRV